MQQEDLKSNGQANGASSTIDTSALYTNPAELERYATHNTYTYTTQYNSLHIPHNVSVVKLNRGL